MEIVEERNSYQENERVEKKEDCLVAYVRLGAGVDYVAADAQR